MDAYEVTIDSDEGGMYAVFRTDAGAFRLGIQECATQLYAEVHRVVRPYVLEAQSVRRIFECGAAEIDESAGMREAYSLSDPKHPDFHSVHADLWDMREGK